jgi:uncharacterized membrane protein
MSDPISRTAHGDAPLSAAKNPRPPQLSGSEAADHELVGRTVTINLPRPEVYRFWRDFTNLVRFMENIESVTVIDNNRSHWVVSAPAGKTVEWDSVITEDITDRLIAWRSDAGADIEHSGLIEFRDAQGGRGTEVTATIVYDPPAGSVGKIVAKLFQKEPKIQARRDLRRCKQLLETGEISTSQMNATAASTAH